jgi:hypothetical protein
MIFKKHACAILYPRYIWVNCRYTKCCVSLLQRSVEMSALLSANLNYFLNGNFHDCLVIPFTYIAPICADPRRVGNPSKLKIWRPFKQKIFTLFQDRKELENIF